VKILFGALAPKNKKVIALQLLGIGAALIIYNFLTGEASLQNSFVGIAAFFVSARALSNKAGFLRGFLSSIARKYLKSVPADFSPVNRIAAGWTLGFALAVLLSASGIGAICYLVGIPLLIIAVILNIISGKRKESVA